MKSDAIEIAETDTDIKKAEKVEKNIMDVMKMKDFEKWDWVNRDDLSLRDPSGPISVITNLCAGTAETEGPYSEKKEKFTKQMETIFDDCGYTIKVEDEVDTSKGSKKYRRIDIFYELKSGN